MAKALNHSDSEPENQDETDIFGEIRKKEIERFFARKLKAYMSSDVKPQNEKANQSQASSNVDLEKELLNFLDDFQTFKNSDEKSVTSDDISDSDSESDSDETFTDDASVVVEEDNSGLSSELIELLTGTRREEKENVEEKKLSLMDLGVDELDQELQKNHDFLSDFQAEVNQAQEKAKTDKQKNRVVKCKYCNGTFEVAGDFIKALREHSKEFHTEKGRDKKEKNNLSSAQSECSSIVENANLPSYISTNDKNLLCCDICHGKVIGKFRNQILKHSQSEEHRNNIQTRFDEPKKETNKKNEHGNKIQSDKPKKEKKTKDEGKENSEKHVKKDSKKGDALAYALGLACIKPVSENQWECSMCNKTIPVAKEYSNLMRNISQHIQGDIHVKKLQELEGSLKDIKEKPDVQKAKKKLKDNVYKFICIPCERDGYGYEFCKSHLASAAHKSKIYKIVELKTPANFRNGVKCGGCEKFIFGANVDINEHCTECIKKNGFKNRRRNRRRGQRKQKDTESGPQEEKGQRHHKGRGPRLQKGPKPQNENGPSPSTNNDNRGRRPHGQKPHQAYRYEPRQDQANQSDIVGQFANLVTGKVAEIIVNQAQMNQYPPNQYQPRVAVASGTRDGFVNVEQVPARPKQQKKKEKESCVIS